MVLYRHCVLFERQKSKLYSYERKQKKIKKLFTNVKNILKHLKERHLWHRNLNVISNFLITKMFAEHDEYTKRISSSSYHVGDKEIPTTAGIAVTTEEHFPEPDNAIFTQRVITGTMALLFSFFFIIFIVFISRKCCPPTLRRIRQCSMIQNHRQLRSQTRLHMSNMSDQGPYNEYEPTHEGPFIIINGYGQCKCQQLPYKECEV